MQRGYIDLNSLSIDLFNFFRSRDINLNIALANKKGVNKLFYSGQFSPLNSMDSNHLNFLKKNFNSYSLLDVKLVTGRTHQIRTQLAHLGFPILGDDKYGDFILNKALKKIGLKRMLLHAAELGFIHPISLEKILIKAPMPTHISNFISNNE